MEQHKQFFKSKIKTPIQLADVVVFRVENAYGEGVFSGGGASLIPESVYQRNPPAEKLFNAEIYSLLKRGYAFSACASLSDLEKYFTSEVLNQLISHGFKVVEKTALWAWESDGQVIAVDETSLMKFIEQYYF